MTENQQKIIDSLIAEFNSRNERESKRQFKLINVDELDAVNKRHQQLTDDSERSKLSWESIRLEYIDQLIGKIKEDIGDRLCVSRGNVLMGNNNYSNSIFICKQNTPKECLINEALYFQVVLQEVSRCDGTTQNWYRDYTGLMITRYVSGNDNRKYKDEVEFFNCKYTKNKLKELLS
jgi:hypothetical protein